MRLVTAAGMWALCALALGATLPQATAAPTALTLDAARAYMLALINRDRASQGQPPVTLDQTASRAAQPHTDEMATFGYSSHWSRDGKKPEQRYSDGGGRDADAENEYEDAGNDDSRRLPVLDGPAFTPRKLEAIEAAFFNEAENEVNHRANILDSNHNRVGIALSSARDGSASRTACTQEFINGYGTYGALPGSVAAGASISLNGRLTPGVGLQSIDVRYEALPKPLSTAQLWRTHSYGVPPLSAVVAAFYPGLGAVPITVRNGPEGQSFAIDIATAPTWRPGLYYVLVWAVRAGAQEPITVSERTIVIDAPN